MEEEDDHEYHEVPKKNLLDLKYYFKRHKATQIATTKQELLALDDNIKLLGNSINTKETPEVYQMLKMWLQISRDNTKCMRKRLRDCLYQYERRTQVNILPSPKGLVLEMEHERSSWTSWLELTRSGKSSRIWLVALFP
jgi:hypothetical protein